MTATKRGMGILSLIFGPGRTESLEVVCYAGDQELKDAADASVAELVRRGWMCWIDPKGRLRVSKTTRLE